VDQYVVLEDRVEVMHAPVKRALATFQRNWLSDETDSAQKAVESAKNAVWLGSDRMTFTLVPASASSEGRDLLKVMASGNAEVEAQSFGATGHSISYDESLEQLTLKGGPTDAHIWQQESLSARPRDTFGRTIRYIPSKQLIIEGGTGFRGSQ